MSNKNEDPISLVTQPKDSRLFISLSDKSIVFYYDWSHEILQIRDDIALLQCTKENLKLISEEMIAKYKVVVDEHYKNLADKHKENAITKIENYFQNLIGSSPEDIGAYRYSVCKVEE